MGTYATVPFPGLVPLDAADLVGAAAWLRGQQPDVVFYPAGFTWVDGCERDPARARAANLEQPLNLARVAADQGARFVYLSTDYVFDGRAGPYAEDDPPARSRSTGSRSTRRNRRWPSARRSAFDRADDLGLRAGTSGQELRLSTGEDPG